MSSLSQAASSVEKRTNARYWIVVMLFIVTSFNYGDRATLSIAGSEMAKDIGLDPWEWAMCSLLSHGLMLSGRSLVAGCWTVLVQNASTSGRIFIWSMFTLLQGFVDIFSGFGIIVALFTLRFLVGLAEAPSFPATVALLRPGFRRRKGERRCRFLTPLNTSQR